MTSAPADPAAWIELGEEDLEMVRRALAPPSSMPRSACYHAHQAAEKYLKAFLVARRAHFPRVHDLDYLLRLCIRQDAAFEVLSKACELLNEYGVPVRYPAEDSPVPDEPQGREALGLAEQVASFARTRLRGK